MKQVFRERECIHREKKAWKATSTTEFSICKRATTVCPSTGRLQVAWQKLRELILLLGGRTQHSGVAVSRLCV